MSAEPDDELRHFVYVYRVPMEVQTRTPRGPWEPATTLSVVKVGCTRHPRLRWYAAKLPKDEAPFLPTSTSTDGSPEKSWEALVGALLEDRVLYGDLIAVFPIYASHGFTKYQAEVGGNTG
jgi:hypothetical protein